MNMASTQPPQKHTDTSTCIRLRKGTIFGWLSGNLRQPHEAAAFGLKTETFCFSFGSFATAVTVTCTIASRPIYPPHRRGVVFIVTTWVFSRKMTGLTKTCPGKTTHDTYG